MARGAAGDAFKNSGTATQYAGVNNANANNNFDFLFPNLTYSAKTPIGEGADLTQIENTINQGTTGANSLIDQGTAAANTADQQSIGGATAGALGLGNLEAARTGNAGGFQPAEDEAVRSGERTLSENALGVQENAANQKLGVEQKATAAKAAAEQENALLRNSQRTNALSELGGLYGTGMNASLNALGLSNQAINAATSADQATTQGWMAPFQAIGDLGSAAGSAMTGIGNLPGH